MAQTLLASADKYHDRIRAAIDVGLGESDLPNPTIDQSGFIGEAVHEVKLVIPNAEALTGDNLERVKNATIWYAAARLCHVVVRKTAMSSQTRGNHSIQIKSYDPDEKESTLRGWADTALADLKATLTSAEAGESKVRKKRPKMLAVASGKRGR